MDYEMDGMGCKIMELEGCKESLGRWVGRWVGR